MIALSTTPAPSQIQFVGADNDVVDLRPTLPGVTTRLFRGGRGKKVVIVTLPPMLYETAAAWLADLEGMGEVSLRLPQPGIVTSGAGTVRVNGAGQTGTMLVADGITPAHTLKKGRLLSLAASGAGFLYRLAADVTADGGGNASLSLTSPIRRAPPDNALVEVQSPVVRGLLGGDARTWTMDVARTVGLTFTISEIA